MTSDQSSASETHLSRTEPADPNPDDIDYERRYGTPLAPSPESIYGETVFVECGCGECDDIVDPLADVESDRRTECSAYHECGSPEVVSIERAREIYVRYQTSIRNSKKTSKYERHRGKQYPTVLNADRHFRTEYENLTTVLFTRRVHPTWGDGNWWSPVMLDHFLHHDNVKQSIRDAFDYHLQDYDFESLRVTAPTESAATPHEHWLLWIDDPEDDVTVNDIIPALEKHLETVPTARPEDHSLHPDRESTAIEIRHDPPLVDEEQARIEESPELVPHTQAAQYLASQLAHLPLGDLWDPDKPNPQDTLLEGGAVAWASRHQWFGASQGVPRLSDG